MCARADRQRRSSREPTSLYGLARSGGGPWPLRCLVRAARCKPQFQAPAPKPWRPRIPASRTGPAPPGRRHPYHLLLRQTRLPREGDAEKRTALGWGARAKTARALFLRRPRAEFGYRVLPSSARSRESTHFGPAAARDTGCSVRGGRARGRDPSPTAGVCAGAPAGWGRGREPRGRASNVRAGARGRARASQRRPLLSTRPSSYSGLWGRGCRRRSPVPSSARG